MTSTPAAIKEIELKDNKLYIQGYINKENAEIIRQIMKSRPPKEVWILPITNISDEEMLVFLKESAHNTSLTKMVLYFPVDDTIAIILADFLKNNQTLRILGIYQSNITETGRQALINALQSNYILEKLGIEGTNMSNQFNEELDNLMSKEARDLRNTKKSNGEQKLQTILKCCHKRKECLLFPLDINIIEIIIKKCTLNRFLITLGETPSE